MKKSLKLIILFFLILSSYSLVYAGPNITSPEDVSLPPCISPCGCDINGNPIPSGPCGCDPTIIDKGCGCGNPAAGACGCDLTIVDKGCGCGNPEAGPCGCDLSIVDKGCGCGKPEAGTCGCDLTVVDRGCGCGNPASSECGCGNPAAGQCGCDTTIKKGCDNNCGSGKVADECGVCDGDGSTCKCIFAASWTQASGYASDAPGLKNVTPEKIIKSKFFDIEPTQSIPACMNKYANDNCRCGPGYSRPSNVSYELDCNAIPNVTMDESTKIWGLCRFGSRDLFYLYWRKCFNYSYIPNETRTCDQLYGELFQAELIAIQKFLKIPNPLGMDFMGTITNPGEGVNDQSAFYWYFDENCKAVLPSANTKVCGYAGLSWSPISLIFGEEEDLNKDMRVVEFSLNPETNEKFALWKASSNTPLLVFDNGNLDKGISIKNLFGNFLELPKNQLSNKPWENGFEALGSLDEDKNNVIENEELVNIKLWFDINKNGKLDSNELRTLAQENITKLFYKNYKDNSQNKDLVLEVGFERSIDGQVKVGKSVDWYGESFTSIQEAETALRAKFSLLDSTPLANSANLNSEKTVDSEVARSQLINENIISGSWIWTVSAKGGSNVPGLFVLAQKTDGFLAGVTIAEVILGKNSNKLKSSFVVVPGKGKVYEAEGKVKFEISFRDKSSGGVALAKGEVLKEGRILKGKTTQSFSAEIKGKKQSAEVEYDWVAVRNE